MNLTSIVMNKFVLAGLASVAIIGAGFFWLHTHDEAIRATVVAEYQPKIETLEKAVEQAEGNLRFEREQAAKNSRAAQGYATERTVIYRQVQAADQTIQRSIEEGDLPNPAISPVKAATIDAIEAMLDAEAN
ncbi:MAG: hypothetical protein ACT6QM_06105 [Brevundimonas mediterranea]|uniref:hypothetical protein n=1 Tax=Brevundimonas mediterranea TaxID=74329 RepID=UPI00403330B5